MSDAAAFDSAAFRERLAGTVGARDVVGEGGDLGPFVTDRRERFQGHSEAAVTPGNVEDVSQVVRLSPHAGRGNARFPGMTVQE